MKKQPLQKNMLRAPQANADNPNFPDTPERGGELIL